MTKYKFLMIPEADRPHFLARLTELRNYLGMSWAAIARVLFAEFGLSITTVTAQKIYNREIESSQ